MTFRSLDTSALNSIRRKSPLVFVLISILFVYLAFQDGRRQCLVYTGGGGPLWCSDGCKLFANEFTSEQLKSSSVNGTNAAAPNKSSITAWKGIEARTTRPKNV